MDEHIDSALDPTEDWVITKIDENHTWIHDMGLVIQHEPSIQPYDYGDAYFQNYRNYRYSPIARDLNDLRRSLCRDANVLDVGVGDLAFLDTLEAYNKRGLFLGYDVNPIAIRELQRRNQWLDIFTETIPEEITTITLWDTLEHIPDPHRYFAAFGGRNLIVSLPIFRDFRELKTSKHFKPNEHLYYFTNWGLIRWLSTYGYQLEFVTSMESEIGRDGILTFRFTRPTIIP